MTQRTHPISLRLTKSEREQLEARAHQLSANVNATARELIRDGLAGADPRGLADRLMRLDRRMAALEQNSQTIAGKTVATERAARDLLAMFDDLLKALSERRRA